MACCRIEQSAADVQQLDALAALIEQAQTIAICAHTKPDGDALGSGLALSMIISHLWPDKMVTNLLADNEDIPDMYRFLPKSDTLVQPATYTQDPDLFIMVDLAYPARLNEAQPIFERARKRATVDHHPADTPVGDVCFSRPEAAAAGVLVAQFALYKKVPLTPQMATCLMCALVTDTGSFQYQNANTEAFTIASILVEAGADPAEISLQVYQSQSLAYLRLKSLVMGRISIFDKGRVAYSYATEEDFARCAVLPDQAEGLIDMVRSVAGTQVALFLKQVDKHVVRGNLRSKSDIDISGVARELGGGGHKAAAGFTFNGTIDEALSSALPKLHVLFEEGL